MGGDCEGPDMQSVVFGGSGGTKQKTGARYEGRMEIARHLATGPWWEVWKKTQFPSKTSNEMSRNSHSPFISCTFFG